jgi:UDP-N-acetyl-D-mannosaminuronic acid dehydrogenase
VAGYARRLIDRLEAGEARIAVLGLGYVGIPVAAMLADSGLMVTGIDRLEDRVAMLARGESPIRGDEPGLAEVIARVVGAGRLQVTTDPAAVAAADAVIIVVDTPVDQATHVPAFTSLRGALQAVAPHLRLGTLVSIESTISPGTMRGVVAPALAEGSGLDVAQDLLLVHCPERVMPGKLLANLKTCDRVIGGWTREAAEAAQVLYRRIVAARLEIADALTAEIVKTAENAYRDVQIAFANELALLCESVGADVWQVRELVNRSPGRQVHYPGAGVGGHCIPKDPWLLIAGVGAPYMPRLIPAARAINDSMPHHVASLVLQGLRAHGREAADSIVTVLGYAYLENSDDDRNSPSAALVAELRDRGVAVRIHDPRVQPYAMAEQEVPAVAAGADCAVLMVAHREYQALDLEALRRALRTPLVVDGRHVIDRARAAAAGLDLRSVGVGDGQDR